MRRSSPSSRSARLVPAGPGALAAVLRRPGLWGTAVRQAWVLADPGWWRRPPFLPVPPRDYLRFRLQTAYGGDSSGPIAPDDLVAYLRWCRAWRHGGLGVRRSIPGLDT